MSEGDAGIHGQQSDAHYMKDRKHFSARRKHIARSETLRDTPKPSLAMSI